MTKKERELFNNKIAKHFEKINKEIKGWADWKKKLLNVRKENW